MGDAAFDAEEWGAGLDVPGIIIWRIESMRPVRIPQEDFGKFFIGDSYIVLVIVEKEGSISRSIHFWLGSESSVDEQGVAAYKTVELDTMLGGEPIQYREVQDHESNLFMSYFPELEYLPGGIASGFTHVERDVYRKRLLHLKGKRNVRVSEVEAFTSKMNQGDVFILDMGLKIYLWNGSGANRYEMGRGLQVVTKLRDERGAKPEVIVMDDDPNLPEFWAELEGDPSEVQSAEEAGGDDAFEKRSASEVMLYRVSDASGELEVTEVPRNDKNRYVKDHLDTADVFVLDAGSALFVWIGKGCTAQEKKSGMTIAKSFLEKFDRPSWTPVTRVVEMGEPSMFKSFFYSFDPPPTPKDFSKATAGNVAGKREQKEVDVSALHRRKAEDEEVIDDGDGTLKIWRVENFKRVEWPEEKYGEFFGGDSFVILYTYEKKGRPMSMLYFWQGRKSSTDEKGASALMVKEMAEEIGGNPVQIRVVQGKEPSHFQRLFNGRMIVHDGGVPSGFRSDGEEGEPEDTATEKLYHVRGSNAFNTKAVQVEASAKSLNSGDVFILVREDMVLVWNGSGSNEEEREFGLHSGELLKGELDLYVVAEGEEPEYFWESIGGKAEYASTPELRNCPHEPRLFQCSNVTGRVEVEEVFNFGQEDLIDDDVMLLDTFTCVFVWVGSQSNEQEKRESVAIAQRYIQAAEDGRDADCPILRIDAGNEPELFTCHFQGWDEAAATVFEDPYEKRLRLLRAEKEAKMGGATEEEPVAVKKKKEPEVIMAGGQALLPSGYLDPSSCKFSLSQLQGRFPDGVDPAQKEMYLSKPEFLEVFGKSMEDYVAQPKWKRQGEKKKHGLF